MKKKSNLLFICHENGFTLELGKEIFDQLSSNDHFRV